MGRKEKTSFLQSFLPLFDLNVCDYQQKESESSGKNSVSFLVLTKGSATIGSTVT